MVELRELNTRSVLEPDASELTGGDGIAKADRAGLSQALRDVATAPGEKIQPGEWSKAVELIKAGKDIDYDGAGGPAEFDKAGDVDGIIVEVDVKDGKFVEIGPVK